MFERNSTRFFAIDTFDWNNFGHFKFFKDFFFCFQKNSINLSMRTASKIFNWKNLNFVLLLQNATFKGPINFSNKPIGLFEIT